MKKFVLLHVGFEQPTEEIMAAWGKWFENIAEVTVENVGLHPGKEVSSGGVKDLPFDQQALTGFTVIEVESQEEAVRIARECPFINSLRVYEVRNEGPSPSHTTG